MEKQLPPLEEDPDYQDLLRMLRKQSPTQIDRLKEAMDRIFKEEVKKDEG